MIILDRTGSSLTSLLDLGKITEGGTSWEVDWENMEVISPDAGRGGGIKDRNRTIEHGII